MNNNEETNSNKDQEQKIDSVQKIMGQNLI